MTNTRILLALALVAAAVLVWRAPAHRPSRYHNHGTPSRAEDVLKAAPRCFQDCKEEPKR